MQISKVVHCLQPDLKLVHLIMGCILRVEERSIEVFAIHELISRSEKEKVQVLVVIANTYYRSI